MDIRQACAIGPLRVLCDRYERRIRTIVDRRISNLTGLRHPRERPFERRLEVKSPIPSRNHLRESNMQTARKTLLASAVGAALLAGIGLLSSPVKADTAAAEATFKAKCAACHGPDGKGKEALKTKDFASEDVQKMSDAELSAIITNGKPPKMPPFKTMTPDQVKDMVAYIRSFKK
jgi:mono/diheme cytochrome c family protein